MEDVVVASTVKLFFVAFSLACLDLFQPMLMKIMFASAVLCSSGPVPCSVAADDVDGHHAGGGGGATTCSAVGVPGGGGGGSLASLDMNECEMFDL